MAEEAKWYVAHTYSGYENKVKEDLEKTVENRGLQDMILEISYPTEEVVEMKDGKRKVVTRKMLPGYVMIKMIMNDKTWYVVRNTRGVTGFVGPGSKPVPLTDEEVTKLGVEYIPIELDLSVGESVRVGKRSAGKLHRHGGSAGSGTAEGKADRIHIQPRHTGGTGLYPGAEALIKGKIKAQGQLCA